MKQEHVIVPSDALVQQWFLSARAMPPDQWVTDIAHKAAAWAADKELEACCADLRTVLGPNQADWLHSVRRPGPSSLKRQALGALYAIATGADDTREFYQDVETIKKALEQLDD